MGRRNHSGMLRTFVFILIAAALIFNIARIPGLAGPAPKKEEAPPWYDVHLPPNADMIERIAGSVIFKIPDEVRQVEANYRAIFQTYKDISVVAKTTGSTRLAIFRDKGQRPWSTLQISGFISGRTTYLIISSDNAAAIDEFR